MKMARRKNHKPAIFIVLLLSMIMMGCTSPVSSQDLSPTPDAGSLPQNPISETEAGAEPPILEATMVTTPSPPSGLAENNIPAVCFDGMVPGITSKAEAIALLGDPVAAQQEGRYESLQYASPLQGQYHTIYMTDQVVDWVSIVRAEDNPLAWSAVVAQYGGPAHTAYSTYLRGSRNFAYPDQGLNFVADEALDLVYIQECFVPRSLEDYRKTYGDFLLQEDPYSR